MTETTYNTCAKTLSTLDTKPAGDAATIDGVRQITVCPAVIRDAIPEFYRRVVKQGRIAMYGPDGFVGGYRVGCGI